MGFGDEEVEVEEVADAEVAVDADGAIGDAFKEDGFDGGFVEEGGGEGEFGEDGAVAFEVKRFDLGEEGGDFGRDLGGEAEVVELCI